MDAKCGVVFKGRAGRTRAKSFEQLSCLMQEAEAEAPGKNGQKSLEPFLDYACHPCAGAMLIFSVSFHFYHVPEGNVYEILLLYIPPIAPVQGLAGALCRRAAVLTAGQGIRTNCKVELPLLLNLCRVRSRQQLSQDVPHRPSASPKPPSPAGEASKVMPGDQQPHTARGNSLWHLHTTGLCNPHTFPACLPL